MTDSATNTSREGITEYVLARIAEISQDWDYSGEVSPRSLLFTELGLESLDAVILCTAIQERYQQQIPFAELFAELGETKRDLSIKELSDFVFRHLNTRDSSAGAGLTQ